MCKGPGAGPGLACWGNREEAHVAGAELARRGQGGGEVTEGTGHIVQGLVGLGEDLSFYPGGGGSPGLWAEEGWDLTQVAHMCSLVITEGTDCGVKGMSWGTRTGRTGRQYVQVGDNKTWIK